MTAKVKSPRRAKKPVTASSGRLRTNARKLVQNYLISRTAWLRKLLDPRRDIATECGHPEVITIKDYADLYERGDVARRIVNIYPEESWSESPAIVENEKEGETEFEKAFKQLEDKHRIFHYLQRADVLSGVGRFGILLFGIDDGLELDQEVQVGGERKLLYLRPFEEAFVTIAGLEEDIANERFGLPKFYDIQVTDTSLNTLPDGATTEVKAAKALKVHHSRVLHLADNRQNSDVYGRPRMECVFNRLMDLRKITGGSGEMFWKGGFPGLSLEAADPTEDLEIDQEATEDMMDKYMNGMQRYIALAGMQAKSLAPQVADPRPHVEVQLKLIAAAWGIPWRIFVGSEQAQLASGQDMIAWNRRINRRRQEYLNPFVVQPLVDKFMEIGILPQVEEFSVKWPDLNAPSEEEKATVAEKKTNALSKYVQGGIDAVVPPFQFLTLVLGFSDEEAKGILDEAGDRIDELTPEFKDQRMEEKAAAAADRAAEIAAARPTPGRGVASPQTGR